MFAAVLRLKVNMGKSEFVLVGEVVGVEEIAEVFVVKWVLYP